MPQGEGTYGSKQGRPPKKKNDKVMTMSKENFKPHKMYCKDGSVHNTKTYEEHLKLKKRGCGHSKKEAMKMKHK